MRQLVLIVSLFVLLPLPALADQVTLKNGDRLSGMIVKSDGKVLSLHTDYADDLTIKWDAVQGIESSTPLHVELPDGKTAVGTVRTFDGQLQIATSSGTVEAPVSGVKSVRNETEEVAYEKTVHPGLLQGWKTGVNVGFALTRGNSQTKNLSLAFLGTRQTMKDKLGLYANSVYVANDAPGAVPSTTANTAGGGLRYDHDISKRLFGFVAADFFSDALQGLNLRSVFGSGLGFHAIKNEQTTLDFLGGVDYTHESYTTLSRNLPELTLGEEFMHKLGKSTVLNERLMLYPDLKSSGDFRGTFDFGTVTKMNKWLGWQNTVSDIYVTNPPLGKRQNDLILTTGLSVTFGQ